MWFAPGQYLQYLSMDSEIMCRYVGGNYASTSGVVAYHPIGDHSFENSRPEANYFPASASDCFF